MEVVLQKLSAKSGRDIYEMLQEIPAEENGFMNACHGKSAAAFEKWLVSAEEMAAGIHLAEGLVPQTIYFLYIDGQPVGFGKLRHRLTEALRKDGGHIGYSIRPTARGKGYGKLLLKLLLQEARDMGIGEILVTIENENAPSIGIAIANGGRIRKVTEENHYIWFEIPSDGMKE